LMEPVAPPDGTPIEAGILEDELRHYLVETPPEVILAAIAEAVGPSAIDGWRRLAARFGSWMTENQELVAQIPRLVKNLSANEQLLKRGIEVLQQEGFSSTLIALTAREAIQFAGLSPEDTQSRLYAYTSSSVFTNELLELYASTGLRPERSTLLSAALELHQSSRFAGAVPLLYSQIEGIVTDALRELKLVPRSRSGFPGLKDKLKTAHDGVASDTDIFLRLLEDSLAPKDPKSTIANTRNAVLHGSDLAFATSKRSTQIMLWTYAMLIKLRSVLPLPSDKSEAV
jgi:hypothetical protein